METKLIENKEEFHILWQQSNSSLLQSWNWGEVKKSSWKIIRITIDNYPLQIFIKKLPLTGQKFGYIPRPFLNFIPNQEFLNQLIDFAKDRLKLSHLIVDPHIDKDKNTTLKESGFIESGKTIQPNQTNLVELGDPNDPWMMMKGKYRRNIKKSIRDGCKIEILDHGNEAVSRFYKVMEEVFARTKYVMYGKEYFDNVWDSLVVDKLAKIYIATKDGVDVGAYLVTFDNEYAYEFYGGVTDGGRDVEAGYLLKWESIKDAKSMGKKYYDHWGIAPFKDNDYEKGHELYNISKFKEGFGGIKVEYAKQHIVVFNKFSYLIYKVGLGVNGLVLAIKKLI